MQPSPPPSGGLFPDTPQQPQTRRFASNIPTLQQQGYEPQPRMQQTGQIPVLQVRQQTGQIPVMPPVPYATGQLQPLHGGVPVQQLPPMSAMPVAPAYTPAPQPVRQAAPQPVQQPAPRPVQEPAPQQAAPRRGKRAKAAPQDELPATALTGTPLMVYTVQGMPVAVNAEEMERALEEHGSKGKKSAKQSAKQSEKESGKQKKEKRSKEKQSGKFVMKFSVAWLIFGIIGIISTVLLLLEWVGMPLLVLLHDLLAGGGV